MRHQQFAAAHIAILERGLARWFGPQHAVEMLVQQNLGKSVQYGAIQLHADPSFLVFARITDTG
jgi:hypothetical protein